MAQLNPRGVDALLRSPLAKRVVREAAANVAAVADALQTGALAGDVTVVYDAPAHTKRSKGRATARVVVTGRAYRTKSSRDGAPVGGSPNSLISAIQHFRKGA